MKPFSRIFLVLPLVVLLHSTAMAEHSATELTTYRITIDTAGFPKPITGGIWGAAADTVAIDSTSDFLYGVTATSWGDTVIAGQKIKIYRFLTGESLVASVPYKIKKIHDHSTLQLYTAYDTDSTYEHGAHWVAYDTPETRRVVIRSFTDVDTVYVCNHNEDNTSGYRLSPGEALELFINLNNADLWLDAGEAGTVVEVITESN